MIQDPNNKASETAERVYSSTRYGCFSFTGSNTIDSNHISSNCHLQTIGHMSLVKYVVKICAASDDYDSLLDEDRIGSAQCTQTVNFHVLIRILTVINRSSLDM
jgi:hypothetical protein